MPAIAGRKISYKFRFRVDKKFQGSLQELLQVFTTEMWTEILGYVSETIGGFFKILQALKICI